MKKRIFKKRLYCLIVTLLFLFTLSSNYLQAGNRAADISTGDLIISGTSTDIFDAKITYNPGIFAIPAQTQAEANSSAQTQTVAIGTTVTFTDMGVDVSDYVLIGWHTNPLAVSVNSYTLEDIVNALPTFYAIGDSLTITEDMTLYAVWVLDINNNGIADYLENEMRPTGVAIPGPISAQEDDISLRSDGLPKWDTSYDATAYNDSVYYVGCMYNNNHSQGLWETLIRLVHPDYTFNNAITTPDTVMNLVIEYGGVLDNNSMIGGKDQQALSKIKITAAMVSSGITLDELIDNYPLMFNSIREDGQGVLKMYFTFRDTEEHPGMTYFSPSITWPKPFKDPETGSYTDTLTLKFNIYNRPEFKSEIIRQSVDLQGYINLNHLNGTPLKYMMRCINGLRWRPVTEPLSNAERGEIGDGISICLREMDMTIGYQNFQKEYYRSDKFDPNIHTNEWSALYGKFVGEVSDSIWIADFVGDPIYTSTIGPMYDMLMALPGASHNDVVSVLIGAYAGLLTPPKNSIVLGQQIAASAQAKAEAYWPILGEEKAEAVFVPEPCRGMFCFAFESKASPGIQREIYIPQVDGVTIDLGYGTHYVQSQSDFTFSAKYTTEQPLKVITDRIVEGGEEEIFGIPNENGGYEYVIRQVTQDIVLTFVPGSVDNASVIDGTIVWSYNNAIYIRVAKEDIASIYSIAGQMVKRIELSEGDTSVSMERGVYMVALKDGTVHKVIVK